MKKKILSWGKGGRVINVDSICGSKIDKIVKN